MKKEYSAPETEIIEIKINDVITTSCIDNNSGELDPSQP